MKNMLGFVAAFAVAALSVNAAQVTWNATGANTDKDGNTLNGTKVALVLADTGKGAGDISWDGSKFTGGTLADVGVLTSGKSSGNTMALTGTWGSGTVAGEDFDGNGISTTAPGTGTAGAVKYFLVVFDSSDVTGGNYTVLSATKDAYASSATAASVGVIFSAAAGKTSSWTPVPEPCTVALLALGLAAVGLKRKVA